MNRLIEFNKTYRVKNPAGGYHLWRLMEIADNKIRVKDLGTGEKFSVSKKDFTNKLDSGQIYVSAKKDFTATSGLSDRDEEVFGQGGCWELALVLAKHGMKFAVVKEEREYLGEPDISYPHAFAVDGDVAVDVYGRTSLAKLEAKWAKLASGKVSILQGDAAKATLKDWHPNASLTATAEKLVEKNRQFFFGKPKFYEVVVSHKSTYRVAAKNITLDYNPSNFGASIDGDFDYIQPITVSVSKLHGFEPDDKMNRPESKKNLEVMKDSIKAGDKMPPLLVREWGSGYQVMDGHHRYHAQKQMGVKRISVRVVPEEYITEINVVPRKGTYVAAIEEGFKIGPFNKKLYHGSTKPVSKWSLKGDGRYGNGLYLTEDKTVATFYSQGGRQGSAGQKLGKVGYLYEFTVSGKAFTVINEQKTMSEMSGSYEPAEQAFDYVGDVFSVLVTKHLGAWVDEEYGINIVELNSDDMGVLSPLPQVLITDLKVIKSTKLLD